MAAMADACMGLARWLLTVQHTDVGRVSSHLARLLVQTAVDWVEGVQSTPGVRSVIDAVCSY